MLSLRTSCIRPLSRVPHLVSKMMGKPAMKFFTVRPLGLRTEIKSGTCAHALCCMQQQKSNISTRFMPYKI